MKKHSFTKYGLLWALGHFYGGLMEQHPHPWGWSQETWHFYERSCRNLSICHSVASSTSGLSHSAWGSGPYRCNMQSTWHRLLYKRNINLSCLSWSADLLPCHSFFSFIIFDFGKHYFIEAVFITVPKKISFSTCIRPLLRPTWKFFAWPGLLIGHRDPAWIRRQW